MISKQTIYDPATLTIESNALSFKFDRKAYMKKKAHLDNSRSIQQFASESKMTDSDSCNFQAYQNGRWTNEENQRFIEALFIYGTDWKKVQTYIKTRTSIQSRSHAQKFFITFNKKYEEVYGKEANSPLESNSNTQADHIFKILSKMHNCQFITALCNDLPQLLIKNNNKSNIDIEIFSLNKCIQKEDKGSKPLSIVLLKKAIEERRESFIKVMYSMMKVSSRTKSNFHLDPQSSFAQVLHNNNERETINKEIKAPVDYSNTLKVNNDSINVIEDNEITFNPYQSEGINDLNGTGSEYYIDTNQIDNNMVALYEDPYHLISFDECYDCNSNCNDNFNGNCNYFEGQFGQNDIFNLNTPFFWGNGK